MFYAKVKRNKKLKVKGNYFLVPIKSYLYTKCMDCRKEMRIDVSDFYGKEIDLASTKVACTECTNNRLLKY